MLPEYFEFSLPTKAVYGIGILKNMDNFVGGYGKRRALLVTDEVLARTGPAEKVKDGFAGTAVDIVATFDDVPPNSTIAAVEKCAALGKRGKCDMIIAVGGGSVIDTAKVANILMVKGGKVADHMGAYLLAPEEKLLPMIIVPTTAGTGSEVTKVAVIADPDNDVKLPFSETQFLPDLAVLDPELTVSMPGLLTAATGMDALTHAIEAYVDKEWSPASDAMALHAIRLISQNILQVCANPKDLQARGAMLAGSFLAGVAFSHSMVGMAHGIAHALGGVYHIPHGIANALVLPEVMEYNLDACMERFADIATALGITYPQVIGQSQSMLKTGKLRMPETLTPFTDMFRPWTDKPSQKAKNMASKAIGGFGFIDHWFKKWSARAAVERVRMLNRQLATLTGMPLNLKDAGIKDQLARLETVVSTAMEDGAMLYNPVEATPGAVEKIIKRLYDARISPLPVSDEELRPRESGSAKKDLKNVFSDSEMLYDVLVAFYERLKADPEIGPSLAKTNLCVQFVYKNPSATITVDASGDDLRIITGEFDGNPEVTMTMNADFAHRFWLGKANLVTALTRRQVTAKGNVPKTLKLLPVLNPAFTLYPKFLEEKGLSHLIIN